MAKDDRKRVVVVTGASTGMGREFVIQIEKKAKADEIWVIARSLDKLETLKECIETPVVCLSLDLSKQSDLDKYKEKLAKENPNVVVLGNCAGFGKFDHSENIDLDTKLNMIDLNVKATVCMTDYTLPYMSKGSKIMNIASCAAFQPIPYINTYAATKAFVLSYSRALNQELKYRGIHVLAVTPFWTKTEFFDRAVVPGKKEVVIKYAVMYVPELVVKKAVKDLYRRKDVSCYGGLNNFQRLLTKLLPHRLVMKVWMNQQKYDGTPNIRK